MPKILVVELTMVSICECHCPVLQSKHPDAYGCLSHILNGRLAYWGNIVIKQSQWYSVWKAERQHAFQTAQRSSSQVKCSVANPEGVHSNPCSEGSVEPPVR